MSAGVKAKKIENEQSVKWQLRDAHQITAHQICYFVYYVILWYIMAWYGMVWHDIKVRFEK